MTTGNDDRIRAALPLAPAGGSSELTGGGQEDNIGDALNLDWTRSVPTLYLLAEFDSLLPLDGMRKLYSKTPEPCSAVVLLNSDHFHFCDRVEETHDMFKTMAEMFMGNIDAGDETPDASVITDNMKSSADLCPGDHAYALTCGLGLAHFDAYLRNKSDAEALVSGDLKELMASRGVSVETFV